MIKGMTISDAAHRWVSEMNAYPQDMIRVLMDAKPLDWREITAVGPGQRVMVMNPDEHLIEAPNILEKLQIALTMIPTGSVWTTAKVSWLKKMILDVLMMKAYRCGDGCGPSGIPQMTTGLKNSVALSSCPSAGSGSMKMMNGDISSALTVQATIFTKRTGSRFIKNAG